MKTSRDVTMVRWEYLTMQQCASFVAALASEGIVNVHTPDGRYAWVRGQDLVGVRPETLRPSWIVVRTDGWCVRIERCARADTGVSRPWSC